MFKPTTLDLVCHGISGNEGVGTVVTSNITYDQFCTFFNIAGVDIAEHEKLQRDPTDSRMRNIRQYLTTRQNTIFPAVTCVATELFFEPLDIPSLNGVSQMGVLRLPATAERMLIDGQGRRLGIEAAMDILAALKTRTIDIKFVETNSETLLDAKLMIRQIFSDFHKKVVKPNSSINLFFDSSEKSSTFVVRAYEYIREHGLLWDGFISLDGSTDAVWQLAQFKTFLRNLTGLSDKEMNSILENPAHEEMWLAQLGSYLQVLKDIPVFRGLSEGTIDLKTAKHNNILCCAIGIESLGLVGKFLIDLALKRNTKVDWQYAGGIASLDFSKTNEMWVNQVVTSAGKMLKGSASKMAFLIASELCIPVSSEFARKVAA